MSINKISQVDKKAIIIDLEKSIKKHGLASVKTVTTHYFKNYLERKKALQRIAELKKEIASLEKKK